MSASRACHLGPGDGEEVEDSAAVVVQEHDRQLQPEARGGEQAADVIRERDVADQQDDWTIAGGRRAERAGDGAVDAVRAAVAEHARGIVADGPEGLDVAHGHRGCDEQGRLLGQQHAQLGGDGRLAQAVIVQDTEDRLGRLLVGAAPTREPVRVGGLQWEEPGFLGAVG